MVLHLPAYLTGSLSGRYLSAKDEDETRAQFKAVGGGVGLGTSVGFMMWVLRRTGWLYWGLGLLDPAVGVLAGVMRILGVLGGIYSSFCVLVKWHNLLVAGASFPVFI
jgi:glycerol-3-phosphate O-acyltransferase/dihydroxyacetone phosphate acyltransferase